MRQGRSDTAQHRRHHQGSKRSGAPRSRRFGLCLPVWYRAASETAWHTGLTRSVSATGAVIRADEAGAPSERIIVAIELPSVGCLVGHGRLVRILQASAGAAPATFAVAVSRYRLDRRDAVLRRAAQ
jgi:hypothetical protein